MAKGFIVDAFLNATKWLRGAKDMEQSIQDLEGALGDAEAEVKKIDAAGERAFKGVGDEADKTGGDVTQLEKKFREVRDSADDMGDKAKKSFKKASEGAQDFKQEAQQTARESAASFDGTADSIQDVFQELAANAFSGFGPAAAAAGIAVGAALGALLNNLTVTQEKLAEAREKAAELSAAMYENDGKIPLTARVEELFEVLTSEIRPNGPIQSLIDQWTDFGSRIDAIRDVASRTTRPVGELVEALSGSDIQLSKAVLEDVNSELEKMTSDPTQGWVWNTAPLQDYKTSIESIIEQQRIAEETYRSVEATAVRTAAAQEEAVDRLAESWRDAAVDAEDYFTVTEEGASEFDLAKYLADSEAVEKANQYVKDNLQLLPPEVAQEAARIAEEAGPQAAQSYMQSYLSADAGNQVRLIDAARRNGEARGRAEGQALAQAFGNPELKATIRAVRDTSAWDNYSPSAKTVALYVNPILGRGGSQSTFRQPL